MTTDTLSPEQREAQEIRALVQASGSKYLARMEETAIAQREEALQMRALLTRSGPMWLKDANAGQIVAFCRLAAAVHLNPLTGEIYWLFGNAYIGVAGRRVLARRTGEMRGESAPRLLTEDEKAVHGVREGDLARALDVWREGWKMPALGVGIVRAGEVASASKKIDGNTGLPYQPLGRNPEQMAVKRAAVAAYRVAFPEIDIPAAEEFSRKFDYEGQFVDSPSGDTARPLAIEAGFTDDAPAPPEEPAADAAPHQAADHDEAPVREAPLEQPNEPEPPPPLPVTDLASLLGWSKDTYDKDQKVVAEALGGKVLADITGLVRDNYGGDFAAAARTLDQSWTAQAGAGEGKLL